MAKNTSMRKILASLIMLFILWSLGSCSDTTAIGGLEEEIIPSVSDSLTHKVIEESYQAVFETKPAALFTVEQTVKGRIEDFRGDKLQKNIDFERKLDLNALFDCDSLVYVLKESELANTSKPKKVIEGDAEVKRKTEGNFIRNTIKKNFSFWFEYENIVAYTDYQKDTCSVSSKDLSYTALQNISWKSAEASKNEKISSKDSTVYDVVQKFDVVLKRHDKVQKSDKAETYEVYVPYKRIFKAGDFKIADRADEDKITRTLEKVNDSTFVEHFSIPTYEEYSQSGRKNEKVETLKVEVVFHNPAKKLVMTTNPDFKTGKGVLSEGEETSKTEGYFTLKTKPITYISVADNSLHSFQNVYTSTTNAVSFKKGHLSIEFGYGRWQMTDLTSPIVGPKDVEYQGKIYNGYDYDNNISWKYSVKDDKYAVQNSEMRGSGLSEAVILIAKVPDEKLEDKLGAVKRELVSDEKGMRERFTVTTYEQWREAGKQNEKTEVYEVPISFNAPAKQRIITTNENYKTDNGQSSVGDETSRLDGKWTIKTKTFNYVSNAQNGAHPFSNSYAAQSSMVIYTKGTIKVEFGYGNWTFKETGTSIKSVAQEVYEGVTYNAWDYVNNITWTYSISADTHAGSTKEISKAALSEVKILVKKAEDEKLSDELKSVKREIISQTVERITITTYEKWRDNDHKNEVTETKDFPIVFKAPDFRHIITSNEKYTTTAGHIVYGAETSAIDGHWTVKTKPFSYASNANNNANAFQNTYTGSSCSIVYTKGNISIEFDYGTWNITEGQTTITGPQDYVYNSTTYDAYDYVNNIKSSYTISGQYVNGQNQTSHDAKAEVKILLEKNKLLKREARNLTHQIVDETTDKFTWDEVETFSRGEEKTTHKEWVRYRHFKASEKKKVYVSNISYSTQNGSSNQIREEKSHVNGVDVTTRYMQYVAKSSNNLEPFDNVYTYDYQSGVYKDKDKMYTLEFPFPTWEIKENSASVATQTSTRDDDYAVYTHTHSVNHTYQVTYNDKTNTHHGSAQVLTDLYLLDIPKNIPEDWGAITGLSVRAVPADDVKGKYAVWAWCLRTEKGAVVAITPEKQLPTLEKFKSGEFVQGSFDDSYNGGYYTTQKNSHGLKVGIWAPAQVYDNNGVVMSYKGVKVAKVLLSDMHIWKWRQGNYTCVVEGYSLTLNNGVLTVKYNGSTLVLH